MLSRFGILDIFSRVYRKERIFHVLPGLEGLLYRSNASQTVDWDKTIKTSGFVQIKRE
jgi:hypothetical protein